MGPAGHRCRQPGPTRRIAPLRLAVATAFHSPVVSSACAPFLESLAAFSFPPASVPVFANATAAAYSDVPQEMRQQLAGQIASPVRFVEMIEAMYARGVR